MVPIWYQGLIFAQPGAPKPWFQLLIMYMTAYNDTYRQLDYTCNWSGALQSTSHVNR